MKGVQQWHALDLADRPVEGLGNGVSAVMAADYVTEPDRELVLDLATDSAPDSNEAWEEECRTASGWPVGRLLALGRAVALDAAASRKAMDAGALAAIVHLLQIRIAG